MIAFHANIYQIVSNQAKYFKESWVALMFIYKSKVKLHHTDAVGLLFFSSVFTIIHDAYEAFLDSFGLNIGTILKEGKYMLPIIRTEAEYKKPQFVGDEMEIKLHCEKLGKTSYTISYDIIDEVGESACIAKTVNVVLDSATREITKIPKPLREALKTLV